MGSSVDQASEERFRLLAEATFEGIAITERGVVVDANPQIAAILGYDLREIIGRPVAAFVAPADVELVRSHMSRGHVEPYEHRALRKDGTVIALESRARSCTYEGRPARITAIRDLTQRLQREQEIETWKRRYELVAAASGQIVYDRHTFTGTIAWSGSLEQVLGYTQEDMKGGVEQWFSLIDPADRTEALEKLQEAEECRTPYDATYGFRHRDGHYVRIHDRGFFLSDCAGGRDNLVGMMQDITHRERADEVRKRLQEQEKLAAIGGIAAGIAHEVKNPLFAISSGIQLLREELALDDEQRMTFDVIFQDVMRMDRLVRQLQLLSPRPRLNRSVQRVADLIRAAITANRGLLAERSLRVSDSIAPDLPDLVVDRDQLLQILFNLVQNAIAVSPQGGRIEAAAEAGPNRDRVIIRVRDEGPGIPGDLTKKIFEPFFTTKGSSAGMGLAISRRIALDHGGSLSGENHPQGGAVFVLELPVKPNV